MEKYLLRINKNPSDYKEVSQIGRSHLLFT